MVWTLQEMGMAGIFPFLHTFPHPVAGPTEFPRGSRGAGGGGTQRGCTATSHLPTPPAPPSAGPKLQRVHTASFMVHPQNKDHFHPKITFRLRSLFVDKYVLFVRRFEDLPSKCQYVGLGPECTTLGDTHHHGGESWLIQSFSLKKKTLKKDYLFLFLF